MVHFSRSVKFSESWEQGAYLLFSHAGTSVFDVEHKRSCTGMVGYLHRDFTAGRGKFKGVFDQVDEHLLESALVTYDLQMLPVLDTGVRVTLLTVWAELLHLSVVELLFCLDLVRRGQVLDKFTLKCDVFTKS